MSVHRLFQVTLRDEMDEETGRKWAERAVLAVNEAFPSVEYADWPSCSRFVPHVEAIATLIDEYGFEFTEAAEILDRAGSYWYKRAQYREAEPFLMRALAIREKALGRSIRTSQTASTISRCFTAPRRNTRRRNHFCGEPWRLERTRSARGIRTSRPASTGSRASTEIWRGIWKMRSI